MKFIAIALTTFLLIAGCQQKHNSPNEKASDAKNTIEFAKGLSIYKYKGFSIVRVNNPWPNSTQIYTYILKEKNAIIPDSLANYESVTVPVQKIIVTSTTHIPSLEMLGVENNLIGFPNTDYISSEKVRSRIEQGKVKELGSNQSLNTEVIIDSAPDILMGFGIDNNNPTLDNLRKSGIKVVLNGDWNEQSPLGKAEWIKLFGCLFQLESKSDSIFATIKKNYQETAQLVRNASKKPTVMAGAIYEGKWYLPQGNSWGSILIEDAGGNYLWKSSHGSGSLSLPFESVLDMAKHAQFWIGPSEYTSLSEMKKGNPHYDQFDAFRTGNVFSFSTKKGKTGGVIYYELSPNRPDLVLKDIVKILHPELLPSYELYFFQKLK